MKEIFGNGIVQGLLVTLIAAFVFSVINIIRFKVYESKIVDYLLKSRRDTPHSFRSTNAISSDINLSEDRIRKVCGKSKKVRRNQKSKESWCLTV